VIKKQHEEEKEAERFWSLLNRYLIFEDPASRWPRLSSLVARKNQLKAGEMDALPPREQDELFVRTFGSASIGGDSGSVLLNIALALEDTRRFSVTSFDLFFSRRKGDLDSQPSWVKDLGLPSIAQRWVARAAVVVPDWRRLGDRGPWSQDSRAQFLLSFLDQASAFESDLTAAVVLGAYRFFCSQLSRWRPRLPGSFLPRMALLVEGPTEAILLPHLARCLDFDFDAAGVCVIAAGGANQVLRRYLDLRDLTTVPVLAVLDADARAPASVVSGSLRDCDRLHVLEVGEIEDIFGDQEFLVLLNRFLRSHRLTGGIAPGDIQHRGGRMRAIDRLWRKRGLGSFDKIGFARMVVESVSSAGQVPREVRKIVESIKELVESRDRETRAVKE